MMNNTNIPEYYAETCFDYGQIIKIMESGKVDIENMNDISCERMGMFIRKTKSYLKNKLKLVNSIELFQLFDTSSISQDDFYFNQVF